VNEPEIRIDQLTGLRAILAPARAERPMDFPLERPEAKGAEECPFCEGHEQETPLETWADRPGGDGPNTPGWRVRAVPNLYPALAEGADQPSPGGDTGFSASADPLRAAARGSAPDLFASTPARGRHEVIIHSPEHRPSLSQLTDEELAAVVAAWRTRMRDLGAQSAYVQLIVNEGRDAGASLEHSHAQLYGLDFVPAAVARERERFGAYHERTAGGDLLSEIMSEEVRRKERLVAIDDEAILVCPWASRSPFELRLAPRRAAARFEEDVEVGAAMLRTALDALAARFDGLPQFNLWIRTAPRGVDQFHWHLDLAPRIAIRAGFEMSTEVELNIYPPERAASELREALGK
jgi:UDPglucose--hexose-1-phosphate uridylyltransferase